MSKNKNQAKAPAKPAMSNDPEVPAEVPTNADMSEAPADEQPEQENAFTADDELQLRIDFLEERIAEAETKAKKHNLQIRLNALYEQRDKAKADSGEDSNAQE